MKHFNKKLSLIAGCLAMLNAPDADAIIRRVGYSGGQVTGVDYATLAAVHGAATAGDTVYIYPGTHSVTTTITKRLVIVGQGFLLDPVNGGNAGLQHGTGTTIMNGTITLGAGSDGTCIMGMETIYAVGLPFVINITNSGQHIIKRNKLVSVNFTAGTTSNLVQILQNWGVSISDQGGTTTITSLNISGNIGLVAWLINAGGTYSGIVQNNVLCGSAFQNFPFIPAQNSSNPGITSSLAVKNMVVQNNVFGDFASLGFPIVSQSINCVFQNNIFRAPSTTPNLAAGGNSSSNNQFGINLSTGYFLGGTTGSYDSRFALAPASPAIGAGFGGVDIGAFGGPTPYKLSGIPTIPSIYLITSPDGISPATSPMNFTISTRSN